MSNNTIFTEHEMMANLHRLSLRQDNQLWWRTWLLAVAIGFIILLVGIGLGAFLYATRAQSSCEAILAIDRNLGTVPIRCIRQLIRYLLEPAY